MTAALTFKQVGKSLGSRRVLDGFDLEVTSGGIFALLGRNGAGKSTALRIAMGLLDADVGDVQVLGHSRRASRSAGLDRIGYVSQDSAIYEWMSVDDALAFTSAFRPSWDSSLAVSLRDDFGLDPRSAIRTLSRGGRTQLALVAALAGRPDLLVLDEPTAGLDAFVRNQLLEQTIEAVAAAGCGVLWATHRIDEVERIADQVGILSGARVVITGTVDEVRSRVTRVRALVDATNPKAEELAPVLWKRCLGAELTVLVEGDGQAAAKQLTTHGARVVDVGPATLEEVFIASTCSRSV